MTAAEQTADDSRRRWVSFKEASTMALPTAFRKLVAAAEDAAEDAACEVAVAKNERISAERFNAAADKGDNIDRG
jgi:hypothetical protein